MSWVDWLIVLGCLGSAGFGFWRGFAQEALSVIVWLAAIWLAWRFTWVIEPLLGNWVVAPELKIWVARAVIFLLILILGGLIGWFVRELMRHTGLKGTDRVLGSLFGLVRGVLIVGLAVIILEFMGLDQDPWWQEARLGSFGERVAGGIRYYAALGSSYL
ncbi:MAG: CvpA family protein [Gammaproteobacteria bacterium]|nr:CvpA family protein [Gammaproteobacteria bacterium]MCZ6584935.1 CvpA family protein [Gammaproteobacteria bacterium]